MPVSDFRTAGIHDSGQPYREQLPAAMTELASLGGRRFEEGLPAGVKDHPKGKSLFLP